MEQPEWGQQPNILGQKDGQRGMNLDLTKENFLSRTR